MIGPRALKRLAMVGLAGMLSACQPPQPAGDPQPSDVPSSKVVVTGQVAETILRDQVTLSAEVAPWAAVTVAAEAVGRVIDLPVDVGDQVATGVVLARLDDSDPRALLAQAEARQAGARAALAQAERDLERGRILAATDDISDGELDRLVLARDTVEATARETAAALILARQQLEDTRIVAPFGGVVSARLVEVGSWLAVGSPVARIVDDSRVKVRAAAAQADRARLAPGLEATVAVHALSGVEFAGRVRVLGAESDPATSTYLVEVAVDQPRAASGERLVPGMQGTVVVTLGQLSGLFAPRAALVDAADGVVVFRVEQGRARLVRPEVGRLTPELAEILDGLKAGDEVVIQGQHQLDDGDPVEPYQS